MSEAVSFDLELEIYRVQRRPGHPQLVINDEYRGLGIVDLSTRTLAKAIPFPAAYATTGVIDSWCLRADGDAALLFQDEDAHACWVSLRDGVSRPVSHPPWTITAGTPYDWRGDAIWIKDPDEYRFAVLRTGHSAFQEVDGTEALRQNRGWRRAIDRMRRASARCLRVESERAHLLYVAMRDTGTQIGTIGWIEQVELGILVPQPPSALAVHFPHVFALYEYEVQRLDETGAIVQRFAAPEGFRFIGLETIPDDAATDGFSLVTVSSALDGRKLTRFTVHTSPAG